MNCGYKHPEVVIFGVISTDPHILVVKGFFIKCAASGKDPIAKYNAIYAHIYMKFIVDCITDIIKSWLRNV